MFFKKKLTAAEQMLNYLREKYQEDFTISSCQEANWAYSYDSMSVLTDKFPGEFIEVYRYEKKVFKDNYMGFLYREDIEKLVQNIAKPLFGECKAIFHVSSFPTEGDVKKGAALEEYLKCAPITNSLNIYIQDYIPSKDYIASLKPMSENFKQYKLPYQVHLYFLKPEMSLDGLSRKTESRILNSIGQKSWFTKGMSFCFLANYDINVTDFREL